MSQNGLKVFRTAPFYSVPEAEGVTGAPSASDRPNAGPPSSLSVTPSAIPPSSNFSDSVLEIPATKQESDLSQFTNDFKQLDTWMLQADTDAICFAQTLNHYADALAQYILPRLIRLADEYLQQTYRMKLRDKDNRAPMEDHVLAARHQCAEILLRLKTLQMLTREDFLRLTQATAGAGIKILNAFVHLEGLGLTGEAPKFYSVSAGELRRKKDENGGYAFVLDRNGLAHHLKLIEHYQQAGIKKWKGHLRKAIFDRIEMIQQGKKNFGARAESVRHVDGLISDYRSILEILESGDGASAKDLLNLLDTDGRMREFSQEIETLQSREFWMKEVILFVPLTVIPTGLGFRLAFALRGVMGARSAGAIGFGVSALLEDQMMMGAYRLGLSTHNPHLNPDGSTKDTADYVAELMLRAAILKGGSVALRAYNSGMISHELARVEGRAVAEITSTRTFSLRDFGRLRSDIPATNYLTLAATNLGVYAGQRNVAAYAEVLWQAVMRERKFDGSSVLAGANDPESLVLGVVRGWAVRAAVQVPRVFSERLAQWRFKNRVDEMKNWQTPETRAALANELMALGDKAYAHDSTWPLMRGLLLKATGKNPNPTNKAQLKPQRPSVISDASPYDRLEIARLMAIPSPYDVGPDGLPIQRTSFPFGNPGPMTPASFFADGAFALGGFIGGFGFRDRKPRRDRDGLSATTGTGAIVPVDRSALEPIQGLAITVADIVALMILYPWMMGSFDEASIEAEARKQLILRGEYVRGILEAVLIKDPDVFVSAFSEQSPYRPSDADLEGSEATFGRYDGGLWTSDFIRAYREKNWNRLIEIIVLTKPSGGALEVLARALVKKYLGFDSPLTHFPFIQMPADVGHLRFPNLGSDQEIAILSLMHQMGRYTSETTQSVVQNRAFNKAQKNNPLVYAVAIRLYPEHYGFYRPTPVTSAYRPLLPNPPIYTGTRPAIISSVPGATGFIADPTTYFKQSGGVAWVIVRPDTTKKDVSKIASTVGQPGERIPYVEVQIVKGEEDQIPGKVDALLKKLYLGDQIRLVVLD